MLIWRPEDLYDSVGENKIKDVHVVEIRSWLPTYVFVDPPTLLVAELTGGL